MKKQLCSLACAILVSGPLSAQVLPVRSGDHPSFSRITIPLSPGQPWEAKRTGEVVTVTLEGHTDGFETDTVFARMPRDRISAIETSGDTVSLSLSCDCDAATFINGTLLVIDVASAGSQLAGTLIGGAVRDALSKTPVAAPSSLRSSAELPWIGRGAPFRLNGPSRPESSAAPEQTNTPVDETAVARAQLLREMQQSLSSEVASAASAGLLKSAIKDQPKPYNEAPDAEAIDPPETEQLKLSAEQSGPARNLRITNSMDRPTNGSGIPTRSLTSGFDCPADDFLPVETWGEPERFAAQIGRARDALFDERYRLKPDAAVHLAKLYVYFGFGAEALEALRLAPDLTSQNSELAAIATIMERGSLPAPNMLAPYSDCDTDIAMWATLGFRQLPAGAQVDADAALRALNKLPTHLRHFLAPALSEKFLEYGNSDAAAMALRSIERLPEPLTPKAALAQANLAMETGTPAADILEDVIEKNTEESPEALLTLVNARLAADELLTEETTALIKAYAQELRGTEIGNELRKVQVLAFAQSGQFDTAFEELEELLPAVSPQMGRDMRERVLEQLSKRGDDFSFLDHMFRQDQNEIAQMKGPAKLAMAERLMQLGFAAQVQRLMQTVPDRPRNPRRQLLVAEAAIQLSQPFQAQAALIGVEGPQAAMLMAQAKEMTGDYSEAAALFSSMDAQEDAIRAAWLSDQWQTLVPAETPAFGPVTQVAANGSTPESADLGPLGRADAALNESVSARAALDALLRDPVVGVSAGSAAIDPSR